MRFSIIVLLMISGLFILSCSSDGPTSPGDNGEEAQPPAFSYQPDLTITIPEEFPSEDYYSEDIEYQEEIVTAYPLEQFVPVDFTAEVILDDPADIRPLYAYHVTASDFDPRDRSHIVSDIHWLDFSTGYYLPDPIDRVYFAELTSAYNVRGPEVINLYRKIDVIAGEEEPVMFETEAMESISLVYNDEPVQAIPLTDFISDYITTTPESYHYRLIDLSAGQYEFSWEELGAGYYLPGADLTIFLTTETTSLLNNPEISQLNSIELYEN